MKKRKSNWKRTLLIVSCCVLGVLLTLALTGMILVYNLLDGIERIDGTEFSLSLEEIEEMLKETDPDIDPSLTEPEGDYSSPLDPANPVVKNENIINILLVGQDRESGNWRQRSDAMILCTINKETKTLTMTSFLRDLYVTIPGYGNDKLNATYAYGGFPLMNETLLHQFGVSADYNVCVDFSRFRQVIDLAGGVDINLTAAEATHLNKQDARWFLTAGINHLDGEQALAYSRIRALDNDFGRTNRQKAVLEALFSKARTMDYMQLYSFADQCMPMLITDMTNQDILSVIVEVLPILSELQLVSQRIPVDDYFQYARIDGKSVLYLTDTHWEKARELIASTMGRTQ